MACGCLLVGYESGNQEILNNIKKGLRIDVAKRFTPKIVGIWALRFTGRLFSGFRSETRETIQETINYAREINPHTIQVSIAAPYPGTYLYNQAKENGWLPPDDENTHLVDEHGRQTASLSYDHLGQTEIFDSVETMYKKFYFRAGKIAEMTSEMLMSPTMAKRRLREGVEFFQFLSRRKHAAPTP